MEKSGLQRRDASSISKLMLWRPSKSALAFDVAKIMPLAGVGREGHKSRSRDNLCCYATISPLEETPLMMNRNLVAALVTFGLALPAVTRAQDAPVEEQIVDQMNKVFGVHAGFRANHAKGVVAEGKF